MSRAVGLASLIWGASILLSRLIGLVREAVIGRMLGGGAEADVFWTAFVLPDFLNYLLAGGALSLVFIPLFQAHLSRGNDAAAWRAFSVILNVLAVALVALTGGLWLAAPHLTDLLAPGMSPEQHVELVRLVRIVLPAQIFHMTGGLISATLQARDRHALPALAPLAYTSSVVVGGLLLGPTLGAEGFAWGVLVGSVLGPFGLPLYGALRAGMSWTPTFDVRLPDFRAYLLRSFPIMLGFSVVVVDDWVIKRTGSLVGTGVVSQLQYAKTLMKVPMGVFGLATGIAAFPTITRLMAEGREGEAWRTLVSATRGMLVLAVAAGAALTVSGDEIAEVIWGRQRFSPDDLSNIGLYTGLMCLGLWAWAAQGLVARGFYARGNTWTPTILGSVVMVAAYPLYGLFAERWGGAGLALASSVAISVYVVALVVALRRRLGAAAKGPGLLDAAFRLVPAAALGVAAGWGVEAALPTLPALLRGALSGTTAIVVCLAVVAATRMPELMVLLAKVKRRLRTPNP